MRDHRRAEALGIETVRLKADTTYGSARGLYLVMARYTLVYGLRLVPEGTLVSADEVTLKLKSGETAGVTLHTIDGTIPQLRRALDRSLDAYFEFLPGATEEDKRDFDDS